MYAGLYISYSPVYYCPMTTTTQFKQFISGHNVHGSMTPGITICGKRTETLEQTDAFVSCQYCRSHMPTNRDALLGLVRAVKSVHTEAQPGSQFVPAGDVAGQVNADMRAAWRGEID